MFCGRKARRKRFEGDVVRKKIQIIIRWLGTGQVLKFAGQVVKFEWLKVIFG